MKKNRRFKSSKLSVKILLALLMVLFVGFSFTAVAFGIAQAAGITRPERPEDIDAWVRLVVILFGVMLCVIILVLFTFIINKTVIKRICKLEEATDEMTKGNLGVKVEVSGKDELSDLAVSFNRMSAELQANEYLSKEFVRSVSHEFKTPISAIRAYGELLETEADKDNIDRDTLREYAEIIIKESDRLGVMSKSILQLSLLDSTNLIKKDDKFKPSEQIREILRLMQAEWSKTNLILDLQLEEITVTSNEQLVYNVWQNLISNAIKFSNQNGTIKITLARNNETGAYFEITDNGIGIKAEDKDKIWTHFYMADKSRTTKGSGLGLPIVKKILTKLKGEITLTTTQTQTTFTVRI